MKITVSNQKPDNISPHYTPVVAGDLDIEKIIEEIATDMIFTPYGANTVSIVDDKNTRYDKPDINHWLGLTIDETQSPDAEKAIKDILSQCLINYDPGFINSPVDEIFLTQEGSKKKLMPPSPGVIYNAQADVIPAAKEILSGNVSDYTGLFVALGFSYSPRTLGFAFIDENEFNEFQEYLRSNIATLTSLLTPEVITKFKQFEKINLDGLTESLLLRKDDDDDNDEYSFSRVLVSQLMSYAQADATKCETLPFSLAETIHPKSIVLVNIEKHARTRATRIQKEWMIINQSIKSPIKIISNKNISKLTSVARAAAKAGMQATKNKAKIDYGRSASVTFRKKKPSSADIFKDVMTVLHKMKTVRRSQNIYKSIKASYLRANRREPQNPNLMGKITTVSYFPDIHIYADTSGSISERHYQDTVMMLIKLAKKMNVNIYFNSFSHVMSQESLIRVRNRSVQRVWSEFVKIPKVTGGTDYKQIWDYIQLSKKRRDQLSIVITDFEWDPPSYRVDHPKNIYYSPSSMEDWGALTYYCKRFVKRMPHIEPAIAQRIFGMIQ